MQPVTLSLTLQVGFFDSLFSSPDKYLGVLVPAVSLAMLAGWNKPHRGEMMQQMGKIPPGHAALAMGAFLDLGLSTCLVTLT